MTAELAPIVAVALTALGLMGGLLKYVSTTANQTRDLIEKGDLAVRADTSKARHDLANVVQRMESEHRRDLAEVKREAASKSEIGAMESRWQATTNRLETKMDRLGEKLDHVQALEAQMKLALEQLGAIGKRLDGREGHGRGP